MSPLNITQPLGIWSIMATISGDVQYTQNGTVTNPCFTLLLFDFRNVVNQHWWLRGSSLRKASAASASLGTTPESLRTRQSWLKAVVLAQNAGILSVGRKKTQVVGGVLRWSPLEMNIWQYPTICSKNKHSWWYHQLSPTFWCLSNLSNLNPAKSFVASTINSINIARSLVDFEPGPQL